MLANTRLDIDCDAIAENFARLSARVSPAAVSAVIKADAYGLGAERIAPILAEAGASIFFVAQTCEGVALRQHLPKADIYVLNPASVSEESFRTHRLRPVLNNWRDWEQWRRTGSGPAALFFDTGMTRLGLTEARIDPDRLKGLDVALIMSHLACADEPDHPANRTQLTRFREIRQAFPDVPASFANSPAIFLGPDYHFDLVRPGMALYGLNPLPGQTNPMVPAVTLQARILQVREIERSERVGYGAAGEARAGQRLITVGIGYADGFFRSCFPRAKVFLEGYALPLVGRVSMDLIVADASAVPVHLVQPEKWVEIIGAQQTADELASAAGTIGYEILTSLGARLPRHYVRTALTRERLSQQQSQQAQ